MNNTETYIVKQKRFNRHLVDFFTEEKKTVIYKTPNRVTDFDEMTKFMSINFLNVFIARENEQLCSLLFETKAKEYQFVGKKMFFFRYYRNRR